MKSFNKDFEVVSLVEGKEQWADHVLSSRATLGKQRRSRLASHLASVDWSKFNMNDYVFTHCTIVASVNHHKDGHTITEASVPYINDNNNAWLTEVLGEPTNIYRSFRGAENFYEHVQVPTMSKGKILDAVLREVKDSSGERRLFTDILVATDRRHRDIVARITDKSLSTLSMGCVANVTQCSKCGKVMYTDYDACSCIRYELGAPYKTKYGFESKVSELCGVPNNPNSCRFIEASWVEKPAFKGAVVNYYLNLGEEREHTASTNIIQLADHQVNLQNPTHDDIEVLRHVRVANQRGMVSFRLFVDQLTNKVHKDRINRIAGQL